MLETRVSVVIPTMNREAVIQRAIDSVLQQTIPVHEIIIIDDGSTDATESLIVQLKQQHPIIQFYKNPINKGAPYSRNKGASMATGELIAFLDSDDKWLPTKLEKQLRLLQQQDTCAVFTNFIFLRGQDVSFGKVKPKVLLTDLFGRNILGGTSSLVIKKSVFDQVGGFTEGLPSCQDWDLWLRLAEVTPLYCVDEPLVEYHIDGNQRISTNTTKALDGHKYIFSKIEPLMLQHKTNSRRIHAMQKLRLAEIYVKNLGNKKAGLKNMIASLSLFPNLKITLGNLKLLYFVLFR